MIRSVIAVCGLLATGVFARADEPKPAETHRGGTPASARAETYLKAGAPGVYYREDEDVRDGRILRVYVVGTAAVSTALGATEGLELARERAGEVARAEFVTWLGSRVTVRKSVSGEVVLVKEGTEDQAGDGAMKETLRKTERRTTVYEETAASLVRGLKWVAGEDHPAEKRYVTVYRWEVSHLDAIKAAKDSLNRDPNADVAKGEGGPIGGAKAGTAAGKTLPGRRVILDD